MLDLTTRAQALATDWTNGARAYVIDEIFRQPKADAIALALAISGLLSPADAAQFARHFLSQTEF
jgi:hypothetical protein